MNCGQRWVSSTSVSEMSSVGIGVVGSSELISRLGQLQSSCSSASSSSSDSSSSSSDCPSEAIDAFDFELRDGDESAERLFRARRTPHDGGPNTAAAKPVASCSSSIAVLLHLLLLLLLLLWLWLLANAAFGKKRLQHTEHLERAGTAGTARQLPQVLKTRRRQRYGGQQRGKRRRTRQLLAGGRLEGNRGGALPLLQLLLLLLLLLFEELVGIDADTCLVCTSRSWSIWLSNATFSWSARCFSSAFTADTCSAAFSFAHSSRSASMFSSSVRFLFSASRIDSCSDLMRASCCEISSRHSLSDSRLAQRADRFFASDFILLMYSRATVNSSSTLPADASTFIFISFWSAASACPTSDRSRSRLVSISLMRFFWCDDMSFSCCSSDWTLLSVVCFCSSSSFTLDLLRLLVVVDRQLLERLQHLLHLLLRVLVLLLDARHLRLQVLVVAARVGDQLLLLDDLLLQLLHVLRLLVDLLVLLVQLLVEPLALHLERVALGRQRQPTAARRRRHGQIDRLRQQHLDVRRARLHRVLLQVELLLQVDRFARAPPGQLGLQLLDLALQLDSPLEEETYLRPKSSVDFVSDSLKLAGEQQMTMVVRALPPSDSCRMRVSFESRYGMCVLLPSARAEITLPSADSDLLMFFASSSTVPSAPVFDTFSEPARSTRYSLPDSFFSFSMFSCLTLIRKTECERDECSFMFVTAMCRFDLPSSITSNTSSGLETKRSDAPFTYGTRFLSSCTLKFTFDTSSRSRILSM
uniref:Uncharacterized protein n=1 Tax=Anopheles atroparvus TaxID=41427 RepID=A0A182J2R4_ANOAO